MKRWVEIAVACAACAACAGDLTFPDAVNGVVEMTGEGKDEIVHSRSEPVTVKTCGVYGLVYMGRKLGHGTMLAGNKDVNVDRHCPDASWYEYRQAYLTEGESGGTMRDVLHYGHYRGLGGFAFKEGRVVELKPVYAVFDGGLELGHGESLSGNTYRFDAVYAGLSRNHSRPLLRYRQTAFNTDHWDVKPKSEIVYAHELAGRKLLSGTVALAVSFSSGTGPVQVSASRDGESWVPLGAITNKCEVSLPVPSALFPASRLLVRFVGEPRVRLQIRSYGFDGTVDGAPIRAFGSTRYLEAETGALFGAIEVPAYAAEIAPVNAHRLPSPSSAAVWSAVEDVKVFRTTPVPKTTGRALSLSLAGNEAESVQLVVAPQADARDVRVETADLVCGEGAGAFRLPAAAVQVARVAYVTIRQPTDEMGARGEWPDPLLPQDGAAFPVKAGSNQPFWITVKAPIGQPKGLYRGTLGVSISFASDAAATHIDVPFEVEVFDFDLPARMTCQSPSGFSPQRVAQFHGVKPGSLEHDIVLEKYMQMLGDHHISSYRWGKGERLSVKWRNASDPARAEPVFDWEAFDDAHAELIGRFHFNAFWIRLDKDGLGHGFQGVFEPGVICGVPQTNALYETLLAKYLGAIERHIVEKGWLNEAYLYPFDEPHPRLFGQIDEVMRLVKRCAPRLRRTVSAAPSRAIGEGVNLWTPRLDIIHSLDEAYFRARGDAFWWYICCGPRAPYPTSFIDHMGCELRTWLWMTWGYNVSGAHVWETTVWTTSPKYPDPKAPQDPYVDAMSWSSSRATPWGNGDGRFVYPPVAATGGRVPSSPVLEGPNSSYRLEILRDGIEDYEYFAMLKRAVPDHPLLKVPEDVFRNERSFSHDPSHMRIHRAKLARAIERLPAAIRRLPPPETCVPARPASGEGFRLQTVAGGTVAVNNFDDTIQETLWRVENGALDGLAVQTVALVLGTQNVGCTPDDMAAGMKCVLDAIRSRRPDVKVLLYASFPTRLTWRNLRNRAANARYAAFADGKHVIFRDINDRLSPALFPDGIHPNGKALDIWLADLAAASP